MSDALPILADFPQKHDFLVCIDSDGTAFDTMEIKHKECFIPMIIEHWDLQPVSKFARSAAEFVNLYSKDRGMNRFPALTKAFDLLEDWPDVQRRNAVIPKAQALRDWIARESKLGNPALKAEVDRTGDPVLTTALRWTEAVNQTIGRMVHGVPPFPYVAESLDKISAWADVLVCSATPTEALIREWEEHDLAKYVGLIGGQEVGSKKDQIAQVSAGKYEKSNVIMLGDALGDMKAGKDNEVAFFPINPGFEDASWEFFLREAADTFRNGRYAGAYEADLIAKFDNLLPTTPWWKTGAAAPV
ncbi:MAG TPA: HAD family hydrolase [Candidatus Dormibacteraeota bacterium]|nr:HAD family hydrolase [Candidatus Dormibacteraeota bacterium]